MNRQQRQRAEFFAQLASLPSLEKLPDWQKLKLVEDAQHAGFGAGSVKVKGEPLHFRQLSDSPGAKQSWGMSGDVPLSWEMLVKADPVARTVINGLLDGKAVSLRGLNLSRYPEIILDSSGRFVHFMRDSDSMSEEMIGALVGTLLQQFPYRRCACGTIFVPVKRQQYCSPACPAKGVDSERKKERREYMRKYMADKRKKAKQRARKGR